MVTENTAEPQTVHAFRLWAYWFVLAQTEKEETYIPPIPEFDIDTALRVLNITRIPFDEINGSIQGFANGHQIAINPLAALRHKTSFHEIAHVLLGQTTTEKLVDGEQTPRHLREVEAESVTLICCETLGGHRYCAPRIGLLPFRRPDCRARFSVRRGSGRVVPEAFHHLRDSLGQPLRQLRVAGADKETGASSFAKRQGYR